MAISRRVPNRVPATMFDPTAGGSSFVDPAARLAQITLGYGQNPGRMNGGSGSTGLARNDAQGWSAMQGEQREFERLQNFMGGQSTDLNFRYVGGEGGNQISRATGGRNIQPSNTSAQIGGAEDALGGIIRKYRGR